MWGEFLEFEGKWNSQSISLIINLFRFTDGAIKNHVNRMDFTFAPTFNVQFSLYCTALAYFEPKASIFDPVIYFIICIPMWTFSAWLANVKLIWVQWLCKIRRTKKIPSWLNVKSEMRSTAHIASHTNSECSNCRKYDFSFHVISVQFCATQALSGSKLKLI